MRVTPRGVYVQGSLTFFVCCKEGISENCESSTGEKIYFCDHVKEQVVLHSRSVGVRIPAEALQEGSVFVPPHLHLLQHTKNGYLEQCVQQKHQAQKKNEQIRLLLNRHSFPQSYRCRCCFLTATLLSSAPGIQGRRKEEKGVVPKVAGQLRRHYPRLDPACKRRGRG